MISPRRSELLRVAGLDFNVEAADIDERIQEGEVAATYVQRLAME
ncbi:Maf family protein, partial [Edaphobacter sp. HDX4]